METEELLGKEIVSGISGEDYICWAEALLSKGLESENIKMLASLGLEFPIDTVEARSYYDKIIKERQITLPARSDCLMAYAKYIARKIVNKTIAPGNGAKILYKVCREAEYPNELMIWYEVDEDIDELHFSETPVYTNKGVDWENFNRVVTKIAEQFLKDNA